MCPEVFDDNNEQFATRSHSEVVENGKKATDDGETVSS